MTGVGINGMPGPGAAATRGIRATEVLTALSVAVVVMGLGGLLTDRGNWQQSLAKPEWQPPGAIFAPAWTLIFVLCVVAFLLAWRRAGDGGRAWLVAAFAVNAVLNVAWSFFYFQLQRPDWALLEIGLLWLSILSLVVVSARHSRPAGLLLLPYLAWVSFAAVLNREIVRLNAPFG